MCTWCAGSRPLLPRGNLLSPLHLSWLQPATWKRVDLQEARGRPPTQAHAWTLRTLWAGGGDAAGQVTASRGEPQGRAGGPPASERASPPRHQASKSDGPGSQARPACSRLGRLPGSTSPAVLGTSPQRHRLTAARGGSFSLSPRMSQRQGAARTGVGGREEEEPASAPAHAHPATRG